MGASYSEKVSTSEVIQVFVEGVDQLELYFGKYLPQFFFCYACTDNAFCRACVCKLESVGGASYLCTAYSAFYCCSSKNRKKTSQQILGVYTNLGDTFLENIQGLTTLKVYQADERKNFEMNEKAEEFRRITMKVLTMQLNSVSVMDIVAYAGSAVGVVIAIIQVKTAQSLYLRHF